MLDEFVLEHPGRPISAYIRHIIPEFDALTAVKALRDEMARPKGPKPAYPGRRSSVDPIKYLVEHYGREIEAGQLGPGSLFSLDASLYHSVRHVLNKKIPPQTIAEYFNEHLRVESRRSPVQFRLQQCAKILEASEGDTARLLGGFQAYVSWPGRGGRGR